jgi:hypothetical protein
LGSLYDILKSMVEVSPPRRKRRRVSDPEAERGQALKIRRYAEAAFFGGAGQFVQYACNFVKNFLLREHLFN